MLDKQRTRERAVAGAKTFIVIVAYLWVLLSVLELHKWVILRQHHIAYEMGFKVGVSLINAVVLGKVIFIVEELHVAEHLSYRPIAFPVLYKSAAFSIILICFHIVEEVLVGMFHGKTITQSIPVIGGGGVEGILLMGVIAFVVLIPFFAFREFARLVGEDELKSLILGRGTKAEPVRAKVQRRDDRVA